MKKKSSFTENKSNPLIYYSTIQLVAVVTLETSTCLYVNRSQIQKLSFTLLCTFLPGSCSPSRLLQETSRQNTEPRWHLTLHA